NSLGGWTPVYGGARKKVVHQRTPFTPPHQPRCTASPHHPVASTSNHEPIPIEIRRFHA
ncbi:hypothetical protein BCR33DRAFT_717216, partial [Rhizoclosmatium globosum]